MRCRSDIAALTRHKVGDRVAVRTAHHDLVSDLVRKGRDLEKMVLARAVRHHLEDRVLKYGNKTVVFD